VAERGYKQLREKPDMEREIEQGGDEFTACHAAGKARGVKTSAGSLHRLVAAGNRCRE
jgi:hypothetical protein